MAGTGTPKNRLERQLHFPECAHLHASGAKPSGPLSVSAAFLSASKEKVLNEVVLNAAAKGGFDAYKQISDILELEKIDQKILDKALLIATENDHSEAAELLLDKGAKPDAFDGKTCITAASSGNLRLYKQFIEKSRDAGTIKKAAFAAAAGAGQMDIINHFLADGAGVYDYDGSAYQNAFAGGHTHVLEVLEKGGANVGYLRPVDVKNAVKSGALFKYADENPLKFRAEFPVIFKLAGKQGREDILQAFTAKHHKGQAPVGLCHSYQSLLSRLDLSAKLEQLKIDSDKSFDELRKKTEEAFDRLGEEFKAKFAKIAQEQADKEAERNTKPKPVCECAEAEKAAKKAGHVSAAPIKTGPAPA